MYLVKLHTVESLVAKIRAGHVFSKDRVIRESESPSLGKGTVSENVSMTMSNGLYAVVAQAEDAELTALSSIMSLKCPVSGLRIEDPCRFVVCSHNQCFDAGSFMQLQQQAPTWTCPICSKTGSFESLAIDQYVFNSGPNLPYPVHLGP